MEFKEAIEISKKLNKRTFFTNPFFIFNNCFEKDGLVLENNTIEEEHPLLVFSSSYKDVSNKIIGTGFDEDMEEIRKKYEILKKEDLGLEFFYSTDDWIKLEGSKFKDIRKKINKFKKDHKVKILTSYPKEKVIALIEEWAKSKRDKEVNELTRKLFEQEVRESIESLDLLEHYENKSVFLEEDKRLIGFSIAVPHTNKIWVGLIQKTRRGIKGITPYLYHLSSKEIGEGKIFTSGADLKRFKERLRPIKIKNIYIIKIGDKIQ